MTVCSNTGSNLTRRFNLSCRGSFVLLGFIARKATTVRSDNGGATEERVNNSQP